MSEIVEEPIAVKRNSTASDANDEVLAKISKKEEMPALDEIMKNFERLIFQHFTVKEALEMFLVSKGMNQRLGKSDFLMNKIQFTIQDLEGLNRKNRRVRLNEISLASERQYKHLYIRAADFDEEDVVLLFKNAFKDVSISIVSTTTEKYVKFLGLLMPNLSVLEILISNIKKVRDYKLELSGLHEVTFSNGCSSSALEPFVKDEMNNALECLVLGSIRQSQEKNSTNLLRIFWRFNETFAGLTELGINSSDTADVFFKDDMSLNTALKLEIFRVSAPASKFGCENVEKFIRGQGGTLKDLSLFNWHQPQTILNIWRKTTALQKIAMSSFSLTTFCDFAMFPTNKKLQLLDLNFPLATITFGFLQPIFEATGTIEKIDICVKAIGSNALEAIKTFGRHVLVNDEVVKSRTDGGSSDIDSESDISSTPSQKPNESEEVVMIEISDSDQE